ncbi:MAG TPA: glycosyltransferase family 1 protein, partial [Anaeromyxobacteraceae bacterium]|nr:glycosyltransferase family 1 protein [Anaeromyxobacteraceae bacterium]
MRRRLAVVEFTMSAGGVERVLKGLARAFLEIPEARDWEITFLLSRYTSAHRPVSWPEALHGPRVRVEWLGESNPVSRALRPFAHAQGIPGLPFTRIPGYVAARTLWRVGPSWMRAALGEHRALIQRAGDRFDAMYLHYPFWMKPPPIRCPVLTTPTDFNFKHFLPADSLRRRVHEAAFSAWLDRSDRLLVSSHAMDDELRHFYPQHAGKARVVHLGVDTGVPAPTATALAACRERLGLPDRFALLTGWVTPHKNTLVVVEALGLLRKRGIDLPLVLVGPNAADLADGARPTFEPEYLARIRGAMQASGLRQGRDLLLPGYVPDDDLRCLFHLATAFVFPTRYEGFGLPSLEATLAGCPTVASSIPALVEQDRILGGAYRIFDPDDPAELADALASVLADEAAARER